MATLVTDYYLNSLTPVVDLIDMTLAFEDTNPKHLDVVSVVDVDAEERVEATLVEIKLNLAW